MKYIQEIRLNLTVMIAAVKRYRLEREYRQLMHAKSKKPPPKTMKIPFNVMLTQLRQEQLVPSNKAKAASKRYRKLCNQLHYRPMYRFARHEGNN